MSDNVVDIMSKMSLEELNQYMFDTEKDYYECMPVDILTFVNDPYYLGATYGGKLFKIWEDTLKQIYPVPMFSPYYEVILSAAIGAGKSTVSTIGMLYDIHKLFCLKNPQEYYGLTQNTTIAFSLFSATLSLATDVNWTSLVDALRESPYFCENLTDSKVLDNNAKTSMIPLTKNIGLQIGSNFKHTIGKAVFGSLLDEASFQSKTGENDQAQKTYDALSSRADSRYANSILINPLPGHQWLASSPKLATDFLAIKVKKSEGRKGVLVKKDIALWHAKPHLLSGDVFHVLVGDKEIQSMIVNDVNTIPPEQRHRLHPVPEMFRGSFEDDIDLAIMDKLGLSISSASNLFKTSEGIIKAMVYENPFRREVIDTLTFGGSDSIMDYMDKSYFRNLRDAQYNRFIMLDAGVTGDTYGITGGYAKPVSNDIIQESDYAQANRTYHVDFSIGVKAIKGQRINFQKIRNFIMYLVKELGYPLYKVGADQFQSEDMLQFFTLSGFETEKISVVTDPTVYENTRDSIESGNLYLTKHLKLESELSNLRKVYVNRKAGYKGKNYIYDHPQDGSKDISDTVAGFYKMASNSTNLFNTVKRIADFFEVSETEKTEDYYSTLTDEEFLKELEQNKF
jgi:hypothetical protein